jgi:hypothetical protein
LSQMPQQVMESSGCGNTNGKKLFPSWGSSSRLSILCVSLFDSRNCLDWHKTRC